MMRWRSSFEMKDMRNISIRVGLVFSAALALTELAAPAPPRVAAKAAATTKPAGSNVKFNDEGIALVDGKPFFPIGVFIYNLDATVLAELHEVQCNTVLHGFNSQQLDLLHQHGLMAICETS